MSGRCLRLTAISFGLAMCLVTGSGCQWYEKLKGPGFSHWNDSFGGGMRGKDPDAKPSGLFTDRRSEEIEKNLGGNF
ncbi:hypothetical protein ETAA8_23880 [Anatilimnocola aggregata]|uniref:Lipoprotein n=1 Tax=Anatilimnocola aggregata TaxID=2528021 RepID=A0A517YAT1_9BACT|nr:hypothetical protein [Anatilimnocola aggregata]QDU27301.1 hypothetical protein ETAA8_23880 [Anatilimnocola aggregata]